MSIRFVLVDFRARIEIRRILETAAEKCISDLIHTDTETIYPAVADSVDNPASAIYVIPVFIKLDEITTVAEMLIHTRAGIEIEIILEFSNHDHAVEIVGCKVIR